MNRYRINLSQQQVASIVVMAANEAEAIGKAEARILKGTVNARWSPALGIQIEGCELDRYWIIERALGEGRFAVWIGDRWAESTEREQAQRFSSLAGAREAIAERQLGAYVIEMPSCTPLVGR
jgi:hypothetical protein